MAKRNYRSASVDGRVIVTSQRNMDGEQAAYLLGMFAPRYPVPALAYYYSLDKAHHDLQYVMLCSDEFVDGVIAYNMPRFR